MVATALDPLLPTHWFNILHDRPQYVTSAVPRSRLAGAAKAAGHSVQLQQPLAEAMAIDQLTSFRAGLLFCETEGILPAPESSHAVAGMIDVVSAHPRQGAPLVVLVNISGHGLLDLGAYSRFAAGEIEPVSVDEASLARSLSTLEEFNQSIAEPAEAT